MSARAYTGVVKPAFPTALLALAAAVPAAGQFGYGQYGMYGDPVDVVLEDLVRNDVAYQKKAVRTRGVLWDYGVQRGYFMLKDSGAEALILAVPEIWDDVRRMSGREVEVTGVVRQVPHQQQYHPGCGPDSKCEDPILPALPSRIDDMRLPEVSITIWGVSDITAMVKDEKVVAPIVTLEALVTTPGRRDGQMVRVVGKFRGRNLYGDLPSRSQRTRSDWVIKDEAFAVWVMGKKPRGKGFDLDASLKRDTGKWLAIVGRPITRGGITYIQAREVELSAAPSATADAQPPPPPPERPKVPPVVVFALPLDGDAEVAPDSRFVVQFNKDMDESTFNGRVLLRYAGPVLPGDHPLNLVKLTYDKGRRALTVDPGTLLAPGRQVELLLLPGIADLEGMTLTPRATPTDGAADILRFQVGT